MQSHRFHTKDSVCKSRVTFSFFISNRKSACSFATFQNQKKLVQPHHDSSGDWYGSPFRRVSLFFVCFLFKNETQKREDDFPRNSRERYENNSANGITSDWYGWPLNIINTETFPWNSQHYIQHYLQSTEMPYMSTKSHHLHGFIEHGIFRK